LKQRDTAKSLYNTARAVLCIALLLSAVAKLASGYDASYLLSPLLFHLTIVAEALIAVALYVRPVCAASAGISLFFGGAVLAILNPQKSCGCMGHWTPDDWRLHLMLAGTLGLVASSVLMWHGRVHGVSGRGSASA